jgi:hypothetical protein
MREREYAWKTLLEFVDFWAQRRDASAICRAAEVLMGCRYDDEYEDLEWENYPREHEMVAQIICFRYPLQALRRMLHITEKLCGWSENDESLMENEQLLESVMHALPIEQHIQLLKEYSPTLERFEGEFPRRLIGVTLCGVACSRLAKDKNRNELLESVKALLRTALTDDHPDVRYHAVRAAFEVFSGDELKAVFEQAMRDDHEFVRMVAYFRVPRLDGELREWATARLIEAATWDNENIDEIAEVLMEVWGVETLARLYDLHESGELKMRECALRLMRIVRSFRTFGAGLARDVESIAKQTKRAMRLLGVE